MHLQTMVAVSVVAACVSSLRGQGERVDRSASVVQIDVNGNEGVQKRRGVVVAGGRVLTTAHSIEDATSARVRIADGREFEATGVVSYNLFLNLSLLAIDWKDAVIADVPYAGGVEPKTKGLIVHLGAEEPGKAGRVHDAGTTWVREGWVGLHLPDQTPSAEWGGAPLLDSEGRLMAIVSGGSVDLAPGRMEGGVYGSRVEVIRGLAEIPLLGWAQWRELVPKLNESETLAREARGLSSKGELDEARKKTTRAIELDPRNSFAWSMLSAIDLKEDDYEGAIRAAEKSSSINPGDPYPHHSLACALAQQGRTDEAIKAIDRAIALDPKSFKWIASKGFVLECAGKVDEAIAAYEAALKLNPQDTYSKQALQRLKGDPLKSKLRW